MNRSFVRTAKRLEESRARKLLEEEPVWLVIEQEQEPTYLMPAVDLARYLEDSGTQAVESGEIDLSEIPAQRYRLASVHSRATLQEAMERLEGSGAEAIYVEQSTVPGIKRILGILTRSRIESAYRL